MPPFARQWEESFALPDSAREQVLRHLRRRNSRNSGPRSPPHDAARSCARCAAAAPDVCSCFAAAGRAAGECGRQSEGTGGLELLNPLGLPSGGVAAGFPDAAVAVLEDGCMKKSMCSKRPKRQRSGRREGSLLGALDREGNGRLPLVPCNEVPRVITRRGTEMPESAAPKCPSGRGRRRQGSASGDNRSPAVVIPVMDDTGSHGVFEMLKLSRRMDADFYKCGALELAPRLLGKLLRTEDVVLQITEVEAYMPNDSACHGRFGLTSRTAPVFGPGGHAYVYLCYGLHVMLNVVADCEGVGAAVLIRSCAPMAGLRTIQQRRGQISDKPSLLSGPGKVGQALGLTTEWSHHPLYEPGGLEILDGPSPEKILVGPRVGIDYATPEDMAALWRFAIAGSAWISAPRNTLRAL